MTDGTNQRLQNLNPAAKQKAQMFSAYSRFVSYARIAVPVVFIMSILLLFTWPQMRQSLPDLDIESGEMNLDSAENLLLRPRYESRDRHGNPYYITAEKARLQGLTQQIVLLDRPEGHLSLSGDKSLYISAKAGRYDQKGQKLDLTGSVHIQHSEGYFLETAALQADLEAGAIISNDDVMMRYQNHEILGTGMRISSDGDHVTVTGPVRARLNMEDPA